MSEKETKACHICRRVGLCDVYFKVPLCEQCSDDYQQFQNNNETKWFTEWAYRRKYEEGLLDDYFFNCPRCGCHTVTNVEFHDNGIITLTCSEDGIKYNKLVVKTLYQKNK